MALSSVPTFTLLWNNWAALTKKILEFWVSSAYLHIIIIMKDSQMPIIKILKLSWESLSTNVALSCFIYQIKLIMMCKADCFIFLGQINHF